jgi:hypothetical protein
VELGLRDEGRLDAEAFQRLHRLPKVRRVRRCPGEVEVAALAELAVDRLLGDQPLDEVVGIHRLAEQRAAGLVAVPVDQLLRSPLVAGVDDAAVASRAAKAEVLGLEQRDRGAGARQDAGGVDPGVAATDDDDVGRLGEGAIPAGRDVRHRRVPVRPPLVVAVEAGRGPRRGHRHRGAA